MNSRHGPIRVLLIEDEPLDARLVRIQLCPTQPSALDLVHVDTLSGALDLLRTERFDVILLDLGLPDSCGTSALDRLGDATPVIVLSGQEMGELRELVRGRPSTTCLSKCDLEGLPDAVKTAARGAGHA